MNLPNRLTTARLAGTALFVALMETGLPWSHRAALAVFLACAVTDFLDGHLARKHGLITDFGKLFDPLADKVLMSAAFICLSAASLFPAWAVVLIVGREFMVSGLRQLAASHSRILAADRLGKQKTVWQILAASYLLGILAYTEGSAEGMEAWLANPETEGARGIGSLLAGIAILLTAWSGWNYFWKNRRLFL